MMGLIWQVELLVAHAMVVNKSEELKYKRSGGTRRRHIPRRVELQGGADAFLVKASMCRIDPTLQLSMYSFGDAMLFCSCS